MKNTIKRVLTSLKGLKVQSIVKSHKTILGACLMIILSILWGFDYVTDMKVTLLENKDIIHYVAEKKEVRKNVEYLDSEIRELYIELEEQVNLEACINSQLARVINNEPVDFEFCYLMDDEDQEAEQFTADILKELLNDDF